MSKRRMIGPSIAILLIIAFVGWMWSGTQKETETEEVTAPIQNRSTTPRVQFVTSNARSVQQSITVNGITEAIRNVTVHSAVSGNLAEVFKKQGDQVKKGEIIASIELKTIPAQIKQAEAYQEQMRLEYEGAKKLYGQGLMNGADLAGASSNYEQAKASLQSLVIQRDDHTIRAPFAGRIENSDLQVGDLISIGDSIAEIYDYSALQFVGPIAEKDIAMVKIGQSAEVKFLHGETVNAEVSYISSVTNSATRTFTTELTIPNIDKPVSGVTSVATIQLGSVNGHYISPALLTINDDGDMGLKVLDLSNRIHFKPVTVMRSDTDGVWITGLGSTERIVTVGQGFVNEGESVDPTEQPFNNDAAVGL